MRKATKLLTLVLAALMIMSVVSIPASAAFTDVSVEDEALYEAVELLTTLGIAKGTTEETFGPDELVTRQQMAAFIFRLMKAGKSIEGGSNDTTFTDLDDATFYYMISWANQTGIIKGRSTTSFDPKGNITLQDAYTMLVRALEYEKDETLPYPFGYINQAEEIGLDENLPSSVNYGDKLTRGEVAIILANAFYADMNKVTSEYGWIHRYDDKGNIVDSAYALKEEVATVAKDIFGVETEKFFVTATAHNVAVGIEDDIKTASNISKAYKEDANLDVDRIGGIRYGEDGKKIADNAEFEMSDLGLSGTSDDYFLDEITLFVKKGDKENGSDDVVIAAKSNLVKKTVTAADVTIERSTKSTKEYYVNADTKAKKVMTGIIDFDGTKAYLDRVNLPYSYKKLSDKGAADKEPVHFITLTGVAVDGEDTIFTYGTQKGTGDKALDVIFSDTLDDKVADKAYDALDTAFSTELKTVYAEGLYEADVYDINGDGYAEFVLVKDYTVLEIEDKAGDKVSIDGKTPVKKDEIKIVGDYTSKDLVLAYVNGKNYIEVKETLTPVESTVYSIKTHENGTDKTITLKSGDVLSTVDADDKFVGYKDVLTTLKPGDTVKFFIKDGVVVKADSSVSTGSFNADANYGIILPFKNEAATGIDAIAKPTKQYVFSVDGVQEGKLASSLYVNILVDGKVVALELADSINTTVKYDKAKEQYAKGSTVAALTLVERAGHSAKALAESVIAYEFADKFFEYTIGANNDVVLKNANIATANKAILNDTEKEDATTFDFGTVKVEHFANSIYTIKDNNKFANDAQKFNMKDYSKIIVKTLDNGEDVYTVYTAADFPKFDEVTFDKMFGILVNNKASKDIENVGIIYAELNTSSSFDAATENYQIVTGSEKVLAEDGTETTVLSVLDIKTGVVTTGVDATTDAPSATGAFVALTEDGKATAIEKSNTDKYEENVIFKTAFDAKDTVDDSFINLDGLGYFVLADDATILWYESSSKCELVEGTEIFDIENNPMSEDLNGGFDIFVVAEDSSIDAIKTIKTIVVAKTGVLTLKQA